LWIAAAVSVAALMGLNLLLADVNQDEGWYLYAARQVASGRLPFVDFASTQGPVLPFVYVIGEPLVRWQGLAGGRLFTGLLGLAAIALTAVLGAMLARRPENRRLAGYLALVLCGVNVYQTAFLVTVKTYSLCAVFLAGSFVLLVSGIGGEKPGRVFWSGVLAALAAGTRFSAVAGAVATALVLLRFHGARVSAPVRRCGLFYLAGAAIGFAAVYGPFALAAPAALKLGLIDYHAGRFVGGLAAQAAYKAGFVSRVVNAYFVPVALGAGGLALAWLGRRAGGQDARAESGVGRCAVYSLWAAAAAITAAHFAAPFPYDDYQVVVFPLFAAGLGAWLADLAGAQDGRSAAPYTPNAAAWGVLVVCLLAAGSSQRNQDWFVGQRDRIWWPMRKSPPLAVLRDAGRYIRGLPDRGAVLLTQDTYLAVEAGMSVPAGLEMGPFSYFPGLSREQADELKVVNREKMLQIIAGTPARYAAFSGYGLSIASPAVVPLAPEEERGLRAAVEARYETARIVEGFGQAGTTLRIYREKPSL
jgi:hypothetical protein